MTKEKAIEIFNKYMKCYYECSDFCDRNCDECILKYSEEDFRSAVEFSVEILRGLE